MSRTVVWSFIVSAVIIAIWVIQVAANRAAQGEVNLQGDLARPLALSLQVWVVLGIVAFVLAVVGVIRTKPKGAAVIALCLAAFLELVGMISWYS